jgi:hypothetical protein
MKKVYLSIFCFLFFYSLSNAQDAKSISLGSGYQNSVWYSLINDEQTIEAQNQWDLAFSTGSMDASVRVNHSKGVRVFKHPNPSSTNFQDMDISNAENDWDELFNDETDWYIGALNSTVNPENPFDFGWGAYSIITHNIQGNQLYAIKLADETWKRFRIQNLISGSYNLIFADADGSNETSVAVAKSEFTGKNFGYYNITNNETLDLEPNANEWDLFFGQYFTQDLATPYNVTGVLTNVGVQAARVITDNPEGEILPADDVFGFEKNIIGYDWKTFNMSQFQFVVADDLAFFVKDLEENYWKILFTSFSGQSTGNMSFSVENLGTVNVQEIGKPEIFTKLFPNPANHIVNLVIDNTTNQPAIAQVFDSAGRLVRETNLGLGFVQQQINVSNFNAGLYSIRVSINNEVKTLKLIVK